MKKTTMQVVLLAAAAAVLSVPSFAAPILCNTTTCSVAPTATYLTAKGAFNGAIFGQDGSGPVLIDLQALGFTTGQTITLIASGDLNINTGGFNTIVSPAFGAVFSSTTAFNNDSTQLNRVTNALAAPGGTTAATSANYVGGTSITSNGGTQTDISQDFLIFQGSGTSFVLPNISTYRYLFVGILDNLYADNSDGGTVNGDLQLLITTVPEPSTYALFLSGLGALVAFRRYRKN